MCLDNLQILEFLENFIPKYLWEEINYSPGYVVDHEDFNTKWNLNVRQGDHNSKALYYLTQFFLNSVLPDLEKIMHDYNELQEVLTTLLGLSAIENIDFYNNGFEVDYRNKTKTKWSYEVDELGQIKTLLNETYNRNVNINWLNTER